ncbi:MAG: hypothetical protein KBS80_09205 [Bacteroidales bacterium]|nr:hypothetical protein [Candidatus Cryptobacteroides choladohippi]
MNTKHILTIISAVALFAGCSETRQPAVQEITPEDLPSSLYVDDVCVSIVPGAELQTKADDALYYTIIGNDGVSRYTIMVESESTPDGLMFCHHYSEGGELIATFVYHNGKFKNLEFEGSLLETKALLEGYRDCVKSTYKELRDKLQDDLTRECDLGLGACDAASAVVSVVKCASSKNRNTND